MTHLLERCISTWLVLPWSCSHEDDIHEYPWIVRVGAKESLPHLILVYLFEPCNCSPPLSWGRRHEILGIFVKWLVKLFHRRRLLYVEVPDKAHRIWGRFSGILFLWERYYYMVGFLGIHGHILEITIWIDVDRPISSFCSKLGVDYLEYERSWRHNSVRVDKLPTLWNKWGGKTLVMVEVVHIQPHKVSSWWLHDS